MAMFFTQDWADDVRRALNDGPDEKTLAGKLEEYWDFYRLVRSGYSSSWALGARDLPAELGGGTQYLVVEWDQGQATACRIVDGGAAATYTLAADYRDWRALFEGYDALRTVMYRKLLLEDGDLLEFFKAIYFFVECLALIATVPTTFPTKAAVPV
ncbi:hypothetical protein CQY20_22275 [Mycolicibacterium agri]|uniref:SCP2 domain-containing protein n=1 Tax=Mycolicibacterium agri TaxID=36811 RepID=A0A2A7MUS4_MYCAG|nr:hypothetical protein [Mycolicibacterium agri]PEG35299.1 hypothetical protein CQY20_22275 [Mycolicibacterium agri]GFG51028.1 hypothetical protein MAGR_24690 [Mycolicibacterium agri]